MTEIALAQALGGMINIPQFFVWRLEWVAAENKFHKTPCYPDGSVYIMSAQDPANWKTYAEAVAIINSLQGNGVQYALGFYLTANTGYWFFDLDGCLNKATGELSAVADYAMKALPGAACEWSSSGNGLHFFGRGLVPPHSCTYKAANLEFYTEGRGIAFGLTGMATGCADTDHTNAINIICNHWFPQTPDVSHGSGPRPEWRGPTDDAELLRRAMASGSAASKLGYKAAFSDLWTRNVPMLAKTFPPSDTGSEFGESEADAALAMQLAFWTGCDADRIERLMLQSALKREKWDKRVHETYLRELTIARACASVSRVLVDEERVQKLDVSVSAEQVTATGDWISRVVNAEELELRNTVIPAIAADRSIEMLDRDRLASLIKERLAVFHIPATIGQCRKMVATEKAEDDVPTNDIPPFATEHVYVRQGDAFFHLPTATALSRTAFQATYNRAMPPKANGDKEDAAKWCLERWGTTTVHDLMYHPRRDPVFVHDGQPYANLYSEKSVPAVAEYTAEGVECIRLFARHLELFCGGRPDVYGHFLAWLAFNVQNPGVKVRYAPILKGIPGDGKSIITKMLRAAMGDRNVNEVGPAIVMNSGGFTDWAQGACVIALEEMMMQGKNRYAMANAIKENITNDRVTINRKGRAQLPIINVSNFICFTNHSNAVPLEDNDRRWWVIFSPYASIADAAKAHGVGDIGQVLATIAIGADKHSGEIRKWLLEMPIPATFDPNGHAPYTDEKMSMLASGEDGEHSIARQVIETGAPGVTYEALSSSCLTNAMRAICILEGADVPKGSKVNSMLNDIGYQSIGTMKIQSKIHRVWVKPGVSRDRARALIEAGYVVSSPV
jgi:hypothetical protein